MAFKISFQPRPFAVDIPETLEKHEVRAYSRQQLITASALTGRLWVVHFPQKFANSKAEDSLWFIPENRQHLFKLNTLPAALDTTKKFTATVIVSGNQTTFKFHQGRSHMGELSCKNSLLLAEGEEEEPADSNFPVFAVGALVALLGLAYIVLKRPSTLAA